MLGLTSTESFSAQRFTNIRQRVFYFYPNGAAPMIGLLSLLKDESTNDPRYSHFEKRLSEQRNTTAAATTGCFITNTTTNADAANPFSPAADSTLRVVVADQTVFRVGHQVKLSAVPTSTAGVNVILYGLVTNTGTATINGNANTPFIDLSVTEAGTNIANTAATVGLEVLIVGSSFAQGVTNQSSSIWNLPVQIENYTQILRSPFDFTGTAIKTSTKFDESGPYKDKAKETSVDHMREMEKAFIFGRKRLITSGTRPQYMTGGVIYHLEQWELLANNPYGTSGATLDADDNKRIINNAAGTMNPRTYDMYMERAFRVTNNKANEKLVLCGSGFLSTLNTMYVSGTMLTSKQGDATTYGMTVVQHDTPYGTIYYKTHPLFSQNPTLRYNALFLDVQNLMYRYMQGRDTEILTNRQANDEDARVDEWLTEAGLECRFPESHMYLQNVRQAVAG